MIKLLLFLFLLAVIYSVRRAMQRADEHANAAPQPPVEREAETMGECIHCGVWVPASEGLRTDGRFYCCAEHARLGPREAK